MKNIAIIAVFSICSISVSAQFVKGDKFIGLNASVSIQNTPATDTNSSSSTTRSFSITPQFGSFVSDKTAIGGSLGYSHSRSTNTFFDDVSSNTNQSLAAGLFVRRYFQFSEKFYFVP